MYLMEEFTMSAILGSQTLRPSIRKEFKNWDFFGSFIKIFVQHEDYVVELREYRVSDPETLNLSSLYVLELKFKVSGSETFYS